MQIYNRYIGNESSINWQEKMNIVKSSRNKLAQGDNDERNSQTVSSNIKEMMRLYYSIEYGTPAPAYSYFKDNIQVFANKAISHIVDKNKQNFESKIHQIKIEISKSAYDEYNNNLVESRNMKTEESLEIAKEENQNITKIEDYSSNNITSSNQGSSNKEPGETTNIKMETPASTTSASQPDSISNTKTTETESASGETNVKADTNSDSMPATTNDDKYDANTALLGKVIDTII